MSGRRPNDDAEKDPGVSDSNRTLDGRLTGMHETVEDPDDQSDRREEVKVAMAPIKRHLATSEESFAGKPNINRSYLNKYGGANISRTWLETVASQDDVAVSMDSIVEMGPERAYTSIDFVGSSIAQKVVFDDRCPFSLISKFIHILAEGTHIITTICENFHGSVDGFQGDEVTANFSSIYLACMASLAIEEKMKPILSSLRELIEEFNRDYANGGEKYEVVGGLRIAHVSAESLNLRNHKKVNGTITRGKALKRSKEFEKFVKIAELTMDKNRTNIHVDDSNKAELEKAKTDFAISAKEYSGSSLRMSEERGKKIGPKIKEITRLPKNEEASRHPNITLGVPFCIYFPILDDSIDDSEYDRLVGKIIGTLEEYQCGDVKAVIEGNGFFTTFETGDTEQLAARALQAVKAAMKDFNRTEGTNHEAIIGVGRKGKMIRFKAGNENRHELTRIGLVVHELFRAIGVGIETYETSGQSIAIGVAARDKLDEYFNLGETSEYETRNMDITITELKDVKSKKRVKIFTDANDVKIIGQSTAMELEQLNSLLVKKKIIKIRGFSPVNESILRKTVESEDIGAVCIIRPEGQDAFDPYQTLRQLIEEYSDKIDKEKEELYAAIENGSDTEIETKLKECFTKIASSVSGSLNICILESESMDENSRYTLENAIKKLGGIGIKLILVGNNIENPDISEEEVSMVSEEEAKELIEFILKERLGKVDTAIISNADLIRIVKKLPREGGSIKGAYIHQWIGELITEGHLHQYKDPAWKIESSISTVRFGQQGVLVRKLNGLEKLKGISTVANSVAAAGRPIEAKDLHFENEEIEGNKDSMLATLAAQGILMKVDAHSGEVAKVGKVGYVVNPLYKSAFDTSMIGWEAGRASVHKYALKKLGQTSASLFIEDSATRKAREDIKETRALWLMHNSEYFKYMVIAQASGPIQMETNQLTQLNEYLKTIRFEVKEDLELNNRPKVARRLRQIFELEELMLRAIPGGNGDKNLLAEARKAYLDLVSIFSNASQRSRVETAKLITLGEADNGTKKIAKMVIAEDTDSTTDIEVILGLIGVRAFKANIEQINNMLESADVHDVIKIAEEHDSLNKANSILEDVGNIFNKNISPNVGLDGLSDTTTLRMADAMQIFASIYYDAASIAIRINEAGTKKIKYKEFLEDADKSARAALGLIDEIGQGDEAQRTRSNREIYDEATSLLKVYIARKKAEAMKCTVNEMVKSHTLKEWVGEIDDVTTSTLAEGLSSLIDRVIPEAATTTDDHILGLNEDKPMQIAITRINDLLNEKTIAIAMGIPWKKMKKEFGTFGNYSENARTLGRAYFKQGADDINGISRRQIYENLLLKARKAAEIARALNDYPNTQSEFMYEFIPVYNIVEANIELAMIRDDTESNQQEFNEAMADLIKLRDDERNPGVPIEDEIKKLYSWAYQAGLVVPKKYIPPPERTAAGSTMSMEALTGEIPPEDDLNYVTPVSGTETLVDPLFGGGDNSDEVEIIIEDEEDPEIEDQTNYTLEVEDDPEE